MLNFKERTLTSFNVSVGTGLALESLFEPIAPRYDTTRDIPNKIKLDKYDYHLFNLMTLVRNIAGSLPGSIPFDVVVKDKLFLSTLENEINQMNSLYINTNCKLGFFYQDYPKVVEVYNKGKDILLKRQEQLDEQIQLEAIDLATDSILEADRKRREKEELRRMEVQEKALNLLEQYKGQMDPELYEESTKEVKRRIVRKKKIQEQVADQDLASARAANGETVEQTTQENAEEKPKKTRGRKPKKVSEEDENVAKEAM